MPDIAVQSADDADFFASWSVLQRVEVGIAVNWEVHTPVSVSFAANWNQRQRVVASGEYEWQLNGRAELPLDSLWNIRNLGPTNSYSFDFEVRQRVQAVQSASWDLAARAVAAATYSWNVARSVGRAYSALWSMNGRLVESATFTWDVRSRVGRALTERWIVRNLTTYKPRDPAIVEQSKAGLAAVLAHRGRPSEGYNSYRSVELYGGEIVEPMATEPDPRTYRGQYYYNSVTNQMYQRIVTRENTGDGTIRAYWKGLN